MTADFEITLVLSDCWVVPVRGHFGYRADDPYAVSLDFYLCTRQPVRWVFARELLATGLVCPTGQADVRAWPTLEYNVVNLCLNSHDGDALFEIPAQPLAELLERSYQLVPPGQEHRFLQLDDLLERLLGTACGGGDDGPYEHPDDDATRPGHCEIEEGTDGGSLP